MDVGSGLVLKMVKGMEPPHGQDMLTELATISTWGTSPEGCAFAMSVTIQAA